MKAPHSASAVPDEQVSIVVQGPIYGAAHGHLTRRVLESVRRHLPASEVVLSTWAGSDTAGLSYDRLVASEDPGGFPQVHDPRVLYNINRQIVSTVAGLQQSSRPYAAKLRTDMPLIGNGFLRLQQQFPARSDDYRLFAERVVSPTIYSVCPERAPALFVVSDWFSFGLRDDLLLLWDVPLAPEDKMAHYFERHPEQNRLHTNEVTWFGAEQFIWVQALGKRFTIPFQHAQDFSAEAVQIAEQALANNFVLAGLEQIGLSAPRHRLARGDWAICYSHGEWLRLYRRYCDPGVATGPDPKLLGKHLTIHALRLRQWLTGKPSGLQKPVRHYL
jgi:hypothetical protein